MASNTSTAVFVKMQCLTSSSATSSLLASGLTPAASKMLRFLPSTWQLPDSLTLSLSTFYPLMNNFNLTGIYTVRRPSDAINFITVDLLEATALVEYSNGERYSYSSVSRRAILNLLMQPNISLGFWVNDVLLYCNSKSASYGSCEHLNYAF